MSGRARVPLVCLLILLAVLGAATATPWDLQPPQAATPEVTSPRNTVPQSRSSQAPEPTETPDETDNRWIILLAAAFLGLLVATLATLVVRHLRTLRRRSTDLARDDLAAGTATTTALGDDVDLPELQDAVTRAMAHLDGHARPRDAVVAAWVALEEAAARAGTDRDPAQTATEFTTTVLAATPAPPDAVARLRTLYQRARFTDRPVDRAAVDQATTALTTIARSLDVGTPDAEKDLTGENA